jgi:O-antigen/teichoic acid export membrane protein
MLRSFGIGLVAYAASAAVFLVFSVFFVRTYGADDYGLFSLLLNTVSALTMFGNYHGALVSYSVAVERRAFMSMLRRVLLYAVLTSVLCAAVLGAIGNLRLPLLLPAAIAFVFIVLSGLPTSALLASPANWVVNVVRAVYQSLLILAFWALFALNTEPRTAFVLALLLAAATYLALLSSRVRFAAVPPEVERAPRNILVLSMFWNLAHMGVMLTDKLAIRYLGVGADAADVGMFLLYLDIAGRFSAIYVIGLPALTYELLSKLRARQRIRRPAGIALSICVLVGAAVALVGYFVIPPLYGTSLAGRALLPGIIGIYITLLGLGSVFVAYCNSAAHPRMLLWHYVGTLITGSVALAALYFAGGRHISITSLALALAIGQCYVLVSGVVLAVRERGKRTVSPQAAPLAPAAVSAADGTAIRRLG